MTDKKLYHIGFVLSSQGLCDNQKAEVYAKLKEHVTALGTDWRLVLHIPLPGVEANTSAQVWPDLIRDLSRRPQVEIVDIPGPMRTADLLVQLYHLDEVWLLPAKGQTTVTSKARIPQLYQAAKVTSVARKFKWLPYWVGEDKMKGKS